MMRSHVWMKKTGMAMLSVLLVSQLAVFAPVAFAETISQKDATATDPSDRQKENTLLSQDNWKNASIDDEESSGSLDVSGIANSQQGELPDSKNDDKPTPPVPGADGPVSPTNASTHLNASILDYLSQEEIDRAHAKMAQRNAYDHSSATFSDILTYADQYVGLKYVYGGKDLVRDGGFDCSGFVSWVYNNICNLGINSDYTNAAALYSEWCTPISESEARPGDIVFFKDTYGDTAPGYITHVGIYCGKGTMIDAGDPIGYDRVTDVVNRYGQQAQRVYGRIVDLANTSVDISSFGNVQSVGDQSYTGVACTPRPVVTVAGATLTEGVDYTLRYENNVEVGIATIVVVGQGNYTGSLSITFNIFSRDQLDALAAANASALQDGEYTVSPSSSPAFALDVYAGGKADFANVDVFSSNGTPAQVWRVSHDQKGYVTLTNLGSGKALDVYGGNAFGGANVDQYAPNGTWAQKWVAVPSGGSFKLVSALSPAYVLDLYGGFAADFNNVELYADNGTPAQQWTFKAPSSIQIQSYSISLPAAALLNHTSQSVLDPATYDFGSPGFYQFANLQGARNDITPDQMDRIIANPSSGRTGVFSGKGQAILAAAKNHNINEMYFMAHMMWETGWGNSPQARGRYFDAGTVTIKVGSRYLSKEVPAGTYRNFIGWGAYDSNPDTAYDFARYYNWNSVDSALDGAAKELANNYIDHGQNTLYTMRWNPSYMDMYHQIGHQYCTDPNWPVGISSIMDTGYKLVGVTPNLKYIVPRYGNENLLLNALPLW